MFLWHGSIHTGMGSYKERAPRRGMPNVPLCGAKGEQSRKFDLDI